MPTPAPGTSAAAIDQGAPAAGSGVVHGQRRHSGLTGAVEGPHPGPVADHADHADAEPASDGVSENGLQVAPIARDEDDGTQRATHSRRSTWPVPAVTSPSMITVSPVCPPPVMWARPRTRHPLISASRDRT